MTNDQSPLFSRPLGAPSAFRPEDLMDAVRAERRLTRESVPPLCVLDFDGDLTDGLVRHQDAQPWHSWACFHTQMLHVTLDGVSCGVVPRTIGGPYTVLVAEQLYAAGAQLIVGLTGIQNRGHADAGGD